MSQLTNGRATVRNVRYIRKLEEIEQLSEEEKELLVRVEKEYAFRTTDYYLKLIDWSNLNDPLRRLVIPQLKELEDWGTLDASHEADYTVAKGTQHKYSDTALLLCNQSCAAYCRYCFRKRLTMRRSDEVAVDISDGIEYIKSHPEINNVLLTGGDPLMLGSKRLSYIISCLREIEHVKIIRIGSKLPAFNPYRIIDDDILLEVLQANSHSDARIYIMCHFTHPNELTDAAIECLNKLIQHKVILTNQCPIVSGVNDDPDVLAELFSRLSFAGCTPYYLFQGRPAKGNAVLEVPIVRAYKIFQQALLKVSGLARRARFSLSHHSGKIEVLGVDQDCIYMRYHRAADPVNNGRFMVYKRDDSAFWLDDLELLNQAEKSDTRDLIYDEDIRKSYALA